MLIYSSSKIPKIIINIIILAFFIGVLGKIFIPLFVPRLQLILDLEANNCQEVETFSSANNLIPGVEYIGMKQKLDHPDGRYIFPLNAASRTFIWKFCPGSKVTIKRLVLNSPGGDINIALNDVNHLFCHSCSMQVASNGILKLEPNPSQVTLEFAGIYEYVNNLLPKPFLLIYRIPQIIIALFLMLFLLSVVPLTLNLIEFVGYCVVTGIFITNRWNLISSLFPPATYTSNQIIGGAQYLGYSIRADSLIFLAFICIPLFYSAVITWRRHILKPRKVVLLDRLITALIIFSCLVLLYFLL